MRTDPPDWEDVQRRLLAGDRRAVLEVSRLVSSVLRRLRAWDFADEWDDLRQEVLLALVTNVRLDRLRDPRAFEGYVRAITRNKFFDRLKRGRRAHEHHTQAWEDENPTRLPAVHDPQDDPQVSVGSLRAEVGRLDEPDKTLLLGTYWGGHTVQEIADRLGLSLGSAKRYQRRALETLRRRLSEGGLP